MHLTHTILALVAASTYIAPAVALAMAAPQNGAPGHGLVRRQSASLASCKASCVDPDRDCVEDGDGGFVCAGFAPPSDPPAFDPARIDPNNGMPRLRPRIDTEGKTSGD